MSKELVRTQQPEELQKRPEDDPAFKWRETPLGQQVAGAPRELELNFNAKRGQAEVVDPFAMPVKDELGIEEIRCDEYGEWEIRDEDGHVLGVFSVGMGDTVAGKITEVLEEQAKSIEQEGPGVFSARLTTGGFIKLKQMIQGDEPQEH